MPAAADDKEVMVAHQEMEQCAQEYVALDLQDGDTSDGLIKDGADLFGSAKLQELHMVLMQDYGQHPRRMSQQQPVIMPEVYVQTKGETSMAMKAASLLTWFLFNSLTLIFNKYAPSRVTSLSISNEILAGTSSLSWISITPSPSPQFT